jgi:hypothetical protein
LSWPLFSLTLAVAKAGADEQVTMVFGSGKGFELAK